MSKLFLKMLVLVAMGAVSTSVFAINETLESDANLLAQTLAWKGSTISNASLSGEGATGFFTDGVSAYGVDNGIFMYADKTLSFDVVSDGTDAALNYVFQANDYMPYNDYFQLLVDGKLVSSQYVSTVGDYNHSGLISAALNDLNAGQTYHIELHVANTLDANFPSAVYMTSPSTNEAPLPAGLLSMLFVALGSALVRRHKKQGILA